MRIHRNLSLLLLLLAVPLRAQDNGNTDILIGISPGMAMRWQQGTMHTTDGFYDCCAFTGGSGIGIAGEARVLFRLGGPVSLRVGAGWERVSSDYQSERKSYPILGQGNTVEYVDLKNDLGVTMSAAQFNAGIQYLVLEPGLYFTAGVGVTVPLSPTWKQTEEITGPPGVRYADGSFRKTLFDVDIPGTRPFPTLRFGGGAMIPIAGDLRLAPELLFSLPLMETQPDFRWSMSGLDLSVALMVGL
ncbi:MAG: hypothetical protein KFF77_01515 [Bacteroidetes bacterium]|nr:hypothetical protein [Bacteroidota bacterium]